MEGTLHLSYGKTDDYTLTEGNLMLFPPGIRVVGRTSPRAQTMLMRIMSSPPCDRNALKYLYQDADKSQLSHRHLESNGMVKLHLDYLAENVTRGLQCAHFMEIKVQELMCYLRADYGRDELRQFNLPLLSADARFMDFVWANYRDVHNVTQFAEKANCSLSAFKVKFKRVTGIPASQWLAEQKARNVYREICCGHKSLKEISAEYHFSSVSHLGTFCRKNFGKSPKSLKESGARRDGS
jgi:AraC-like DNA-binding protein